jgi:hypothetical protein
MFGIIAPIFTQIVTLFLPGKKPAVAAAECDNKCNIMGLVQNLESYMDPEGKRPLNDIVKQCYDKGPFPALWAVEGAGKDLAEWHMARNENPTGLLTNAVLDPKWDKALLMLHAGIGLGFAKHYMDRLPATPGAEDIRKVVTRTVDLCRQNSRPGYYGAAIESLGLVTRFMKDAAFCRQVHNNLVSFAPDSVGFYWRGVGRSLYFSPANFLPAVTRPMRALDMADEEAPTPELRQTLLAGVAWPLTIVNMTTPEVMEYVLENYAAYGCDEPGFFNGMISSIVMRYDTTPDYDLIQKFRDHRPKSSNPKVAELWRNKVAWAFDMAVNTVHPALQRHQRLDEVFRFQSLPDLVAQLEQGGGASGAAQ